MKNIHVLPTDKPSRLSILNSGKLNFGAEFISSSNSKAQNIYITNDEEIKEGDWVFDTFKNACPIIRQLTTEEEVLEVQITEFKIILTTDQDLIKDGVQGIDDEFLEWFVKNPSCKNVEMSHLDETAYKHGIITYEIPISKKEPKQVWEQIIETCGGKEEFMKSAGLLSKQETLEEAAESHVENPKIIAKFSENKAMYKKMFCEGAEWQQKRSYSEEEVFYILVKAMKDNKVNQLSFFDNGISNPIYTNLKKWFEQFKKK